MLMGKVVMSLLAIARHGGARYVLAALQQRWPSLCFADGH
jgi:hypothetical protein